MNPRRARLLAASLLVAAWLIALAWMARDASRPRVRGEASAVGAR